MFYSHAPHPVSSGNHQQATFEMAKILVKQIKALGVSQAGLTSEMCETLESMGLALWQRQQKRRVPLGFWSQLWKGEEPKVFP